MHRYIVTVHIIYADHLSLYCCATYRTECKTKDILKYSKKERKKEIVTEAPRLRPH